MRCLNIYSETIDETFNRLEHLGEGVKTRDYAIGRLIDLDVRRISTYEIRNATHAQYDTESRMYRFRMWE